MSLLGDGKIRRTRLWLTALALALMALVAGYFLVTEPVRYTTRAAPEAAVRTNPFLAAQTLLDNAQHPTRRVFSTGALFPLPDAGTTLILDGQRGNLGGDRINQLLEWVDQGGEMIVVAHADDRDSLLAPLGVGVERRATDDGGDDPLDGVLGRFQSLDSLFLEYCLGGDDEGDNPHLARCEELACEAPRRPTPAVMESGDRLQIHNTLSLTHDGADPVLRRAVSPGESEGEDTTRLLQLALGRGRLTVLTGLDLWHNDHLHYFDHAWLLNELTGDGPVWFVRGVDMPPLPLWLWERAWPPLLALGLALAAWLWRRLPRPGPRWRASADAPRDYLGHLRAQGQFLWRTGQSEALLAPLRRQARERIAHLHADPEQALTLAARRLDIPEAMLRDALGETSSSSTPPQGWVARTAILQTLVQTLRSRL